VTPPPPDDGRGGEDWTERDIVLTYFPATQDRLVPRVLRYRLDDVGDGAVEVRERDGGEVALRLQAVAPAGNPTGELCCDLCQRTGTRRFLRVYRAEVPGTHGRRYRYLTACLERRGCEARRVGDAPLDVLLDVDG
jgi:hypothetical protein